MSGSPPTKSLPVIIPPIPFDVFNSFIRVIMSVVRPPWVRVPDTILLAVSELSMESNLVRWFAYSSRILFVFKSKEKLFSGPVLNLFNLSNSLFTEDLSVVIVPIDSDKLLSFNPAVTFPLNVSTADIFALPTTPMPCAVSYFCLNCITALAFSGGTLVIPSFHSASSATAPMAASKNAS